MNVECPDYTIPIAGQLHYASRGDGPPQCKNATNKTNQVKHADKRRLVCVPDRCWGCGYGAAAETGAKLRGTRPGVRKNRCLT